MLRSNKLSKTPSVLVAIPVLNESKYIEQCLKSIMSQDYTGQLKIMVLDGGSSDDTVLISSKIAESRSNIAVHLNLGRTQAAALNYATKIEQDFEILIRVDAHSKYSADFVSSCVSSLLDQDADSVVVPMNTVGRSPFQRAVAAAQNSLIGNGGSAHRRRGFSKFVDHGHHAAFRKDVFVTLGGYSVDLTHNEDAEFDFRLTTLGGRIWLCSEAMIDYYPRDTVGGLARQYWNYGSGRAQNMLKHRSVPKIRQLAPILLSATSILSLTLTPIYPPSAALLLIYLSIYLGWSVVAATKERDPILLCLGFAAAVMHLCWAGGFIGRLVSSHKTNALLKDSDTAQLA